MLGYDLHLTKSYIPVIAAGGGAGRFDDMYQGDIAICSFCCYHYKYVPLHRVTPVGGQQLRFMLREFLF